MRPAVTIDHRDIPFLEGSLVRLLLEAQAAASETEADATLQVRCAS
jgi:hypothetical protein